MMIQRSMPSDYYSDSYSYGSSGQSQTPDKGGQLFFSINLLKGNTRQHPEVAVRHTKVKNSVNSITVKEEVYKSVEGDQYSADEYAKVMRKKQRQVRKSQERILQEKESARAVHQAISSENVLLLLQ